MARTFSETLRELRNKKGLTQDELAHILNVPSSNIRRYESDVHGIPRKERLEQFANYFGVSIDYLLGRSDDPAGPVITEEMKLDPFLIFELVDKLTDDEIIKQYRHMADQKDLDEKIIRNHLQHIRLLKSLQK